MRVQNALRDLSIPYREVSEGFSCYQCRKIIYAECGKILPESVCPVAFVAIGECVTPAYVGHMTADRASVAVIACQNANELALEHIFLTKDLTLPPHL